MLCGWLTCVKPGYSVRMNAMTALAGLLLAAGSAQAASNCDAIRDQIDAKIRAAGVARFSLTVVDAASSAPGRNVGSCERGSRKILYVQEGKPAAAGGVITECKDGSVSSNGECKKP